MEDLIDRIYEAALVPERWPSVLESVSEISGTIGGMLLTVSPQAPRPDGIPTAPVLIQWTASSGVVDLFTGFIADGWLERNTRGARGFAANHPGFLTDADLFTPEEIENEPQYHYLREKGVGLCVGFVQPVPSGDGLIFDWERRHTDGPVSPEVVAMLNPLRPHLARASLMASRIGLERARATAEAFASIGLPAAVLSPQHRMLAANSPMEALMPDVVREHAMGRLRLVDKAADTLLDDALRQAGSVGAASPHAVFSLPIPARRGSPAMVVHVVPIRRAAHDVFQSAANIVLVTPVGRPHLPEAGVIQGLFDLTAAETRVAMGIARGDTVREMATSGGVREDTLRHHLKVVFAKTGVNRQADLVGLLGTLNPLRAQD